MLGDGDDHEDCEEEMVKFLKSISTPELHDINRVKSFLEELMTWSYCASEDMKGKLENCLGI